MHQCDKKNQFSNFSRVIEAVKSNIETQNGEVASIAFAELISKMGSKQPVDSEALRVYVDSGIIDTLSKMLAQSDDAKVSAGENLIHFFQKQIFEFKLFDKKII